MVRRRIIRRVAWLVLAVLAVGVAGVWVAGRQRAPVRVAGWYGTTPGIWRYRKKIVIDERKVSGSTNLANFPVLISITDAEVLKYAQSDADDIVFTDADGSTKLDHEIESYTPGTGALLAWVEVPTLKATEDTTIFLYFGNASATNQQNPAGVWGASYTGVWHLGETSGTRADSTAGNNDLTDNSTVGSAAGVIGTAADFTAVSNEYLSITDAAQTGLNFDDSFSVEYWFRLNTGAEGSDQAFLGKFDPAGVSYANAMYMGWVAPTSTHGLFIDVYDESANNANAPTEGVFDESSHTEATWYNVVGVYDNPSDQFRWYVNGVLTQTASGFTRDMTAASAWPFYLGRVASTYYDGRLDEVRVKTAIPTADWIQTQYNNQSSPATFYTVLGPEAAGDSPLGHWKFDEGIGAATYDASPYGNTGTLENGPVWKTADDCHQGICLAFDGTDDDVNAGSAAPLDNTAVMTVSGWFKATGYGENNMGRLLDKGTHSTGASSRGWAVYICGPSCSTGNDQALTFFHNFNSDANNGRWSTPVGSVQLNRWYHFAVVYDRGSPSNDPVLYLNGVAQTVTEGSTPSGSADSNAAKDLYIGNRQERDRTFQGTIDDVKLFGTALSAAQIREQAGAQSAGSSLGADSAGTLNDGLIGHWKLDETGWNGTAEEVRDSSGNLEHGTAQCQGTCTEPTTSGGKFGNAGSFDGADDYVNFGDPASGLYDFDQTENFTISFWYNRNAGASGADSLIDKYRNCGNGGVPGYIICANASGQITFQLHDGTTQYLKTGATALTPGTWYLVTVVLNRQNNQVSGVYINGELDTPLSGDTVTNLGSLANATSLLLGRDASSTVYGLLDDVRIYGRALSPAEVRQLYAWAPGPVGYWNFDQNFSGVFVDVSGYGHYMYEADSPGVIKPGKYGNAIWNTSLANLIMDTSAPEFYRVSATGSVTYEAWVYYEGVHYFENDGVIVGRGNCCGSSNIVLRVTDEGKLKFDLIDEGDSGNDAYSLLGSTTLPLRQWVHVAGVLDRSSEANTVLYLNGMKETVTRSGTFSSLGSFADDSFMLVMSGYYPMNGAVDEWKIYDYARTQQQIIEDMNGGHPLGGSPVGSPLLSYRMNELQGQVVHNTGNGTAVEGTLGQSTAADTDDPAWTAQSGCKENGCLAFDGSNDYVSLPDNIFDSHTTGSVCSWVYFDEPVDAGNQGAILSYSDDASLNYKHSFYISDTGTDTAMIRAVLRSNGSGNQIDYTTANNAIARRTWTHMCFVQDGSGVDLYLNGAPTPFTPAITGSASVADWFDDIAATAEKATIGNISDNSPDSFFRGRLDTFQYFAVPLTPAQVGIVMNANAAISAAVLGASESAQLVNGAGADPWLVLDLDEQAGVVAYDKSGSATVHNGSLSGGAVWAPGRYGSGVLFDGANGTALSVADSSDFNSAGVTYEMWVKTTTPSSAAGYNQTFAIRSHSGAPFRAFWFYQGNTDDRLGAYLANQAGTQVFMSGPQLQNNTWYHLALTWDLSTVRLYVNGLEVNSEALTGTAVLDADQNFCIGSNNCSGETLRGLVDQVRVYGYARTAAQIAYDVNRGGPAGWWKLNECQGTTAHDASGHGHDGTIGAGDASGTNDSAGSCTSGNTDEMWANGAQGKFGSSLHFDGENDRVEADGAIDVLNTAEGSFSLWVKRTFPDSDNTYPTALSFGNSGNLFVELGLYFDSSTDSFWTHYDNGTTNAYTEIAPSLVPQNQWTHIVTTWSRSAGEYKTYVNGRQVGSTFSGVPASITLDRFNIGSAAYDDSSSFEGSIDDVRIYAYPLSAAQVSQLMNESAGVRFGPVTGTP